MNDSVLLFFVFAFVFIIINILTPYSLYRYRSLSLRSLSLIIAIAHYRHRSSLPSLIYHYHVFDFCCHQFHKLLCIYILFVIHRYHKKIRIYKIRFCNIYESSTIRYIFICSNIVLYSNKIFNTSSFTNGDEFMHGN
jgi:hypothetical protein